MANPIPPNHPENFAGLKCPHPTTIICREKTMMMGDVTIGPNCIVHPTVRIIARNGPIRIGSNNIIEERVTITNNSREPMYIGDNNIFEVYSVSESPRIGNNNIIESKAFIGPEIELTNNCIVGAGCHLPPRGESSSRTSQGPGNQAPERTKVLDVLQPNSVVSGSGLCRRTANDLPLNSHSSQLDFLRKILPNYQKLWRQANVPATPPTQK